MTAYLVGAIEIHDPEGYARYRQGVGAALAPYDVELVSADDAPQVLEGVAPASHLFVVRFASVADARAFYGSDAYQAIIGFRQGSSEARFLMIMRSPDEPA